MRYAVRLPLLLVVLVTACSGLSGDDVASSSEKGSTTTVTASTSSTTEPPTTTTEVPTTTTTAAPSTTTTSTLPGGLDVTITTEIVFSQTEDSVWETAGFVAEGAAVDEGEMCGEGTLDLLGFDPGVGSWRREVVYTCTDGSGVFHLGLDLRVQYTSDGYTETGTWDVVYGTDSYEDMIGTGTDTTTQPETNLFVSVQRGQVANG